MIVTFWGVRGSVPVPGHDTLRYGGNTSCVSIEIDGRVLLIDAGTGLRSAGQALGVPRRELFLVLSHMHSDHIAGFPWFPPLFDPTMTVYLPDYVHDGRHCTLLDVLDGVHVPFGPDTLRATIIRPDEGAEACLVQHGWDVTTVALNHPGGGLGWRVRHADRVFVHITDNELEAPEPTTSFERFVAFCHGADVLSHDAQWTDAELAGRRGWGHSSVQQACRLAIEAEVKTLVLFHHDPARTDEAIDALRGDAERLLRPHGIRCFAASEGLRIELF
ncbi:MAG TPA: MBL fold metallo-hydrolase [Albitalea sp.]